MAQKMHNPLKVGFVNPLRISRPCHTVDIRPDSSMLKGMNKKQKAKKIKDMEKAKKLDVAVYIGHALITMYDQVCIMAPYNTG